MASPGFGYDFSRIPIYPQSGAPGVLARQTVEQYETKGRTIDANDLNALAEISFWEQKIRSTFHLSMDAATDSRLKADAEERDAVYSVVFQMLPRGPVTRDMTNVVTIPKRAAAPGSENLAYQINFRPRTTPKGHDIAEILFVAKGAGASPVAPEAPSTSFTPKTTGGYMTSGFPQNDADKYWQSHGEEQRRVFHWIENEARGPRFERILTTTVTRGGATRSASFMVSGAKDRSSGSISGLSIFLLGDVAATPRSAPAGYASHDFADQSIEEARTPADPSKPDKLGAINGLAALPRAEQPSVKYVIAQYFQGGTRNAEVDAIVPIVTGSLFAEMSTDQRVSPTARDTAADFARLGVRLIPARRVLYTFQFKPNARDPHTSDVDIQRLGEQGKEVDLAAQGALARVNGFSDQTRGKDQRDVKPLKNWLKTRYPGVTPTGDVIAEVEKSVTEQIDAGSGERGWFEKNYGIKILNASEARARLISIGHKQPEELQDLREFSGAELQTLELSLERMSDKIVKTFKGLQFIRQAVYNAWVGPSPRDFETKPSVAGITVMPGTTRTIIVFDASTANNDSLFLGGVEPGSPPAVTVASAQVYAHELGHTVAARPGVQKAFDKLVAAKNIKPITWYAGSDPPKELLPEAFGLFYSDPGWLRRNWPDLHGFFQTLDETGKPP